MKKRILLISLILVLAVGAVITINLLSQSGETTSLYTQVQETYVQLETEKYEDLTSDWYKISNKYISKIHTNTNISSFKKKMDNDLIIYNGKEIVEDGIVKTGMYVVVNNEKYTLVVNGDLNSDGKFDQIDLNRLLVNLDRTDLNEIEIAASDINEDGVFNKADIDLAAEYILNNQFEIKDVLKVGKPKISVESGSKNKDGWYLETVTLKMNASDDKTRKLMYEIKGTYPVSLTEIKDGETVTLDKYGAYKVYLWAYAQDGNRSLVTTMLLGVDTNDKCIKYGINTLSGCMLVNDGNYTSVAAAESGIASKGSATLYVAASSDMGLYAAKDDYGTSYFYRGSVNDNFVEYAGYTWRIVRRNGDGSVRLIFNGTSTSNAGTDKFIDKVSYNNLTDDLPYVGYKYSVNSSFLVTESTITYSNIKDSAVYYFSDNITCSEDTKKCKLSGNIISGLWREKYTEVLNGNESNGNVPYKYTCWGTTIGTECGIASEVVGTVISGGKLVATKANVKYRGYLTVYNDAYNGDINSNIKETVDKWYEENLLNSKDENDNLYSNYLVDQVFCNDKSIGYGTGENLEEDTLFGPYKRIRMQSTAVLTCPRNEDKFTVSSSNGNGDLKYPIGLITADEAIHAGGISGNNNSNYWLNIGKDYWTMSPSGLNSKNLLTNVFYILAGGGVSPMSPTYELGVRPVINLSADVLVTGGNGTANNPYKVSLSE